MVRVAEQKGSEAERQHEVIQGSAEVLPEGRVRSGVVRRKQQREHEEKPEQARRAHQHAEHEAQADRQLSVGHQEGDWGPVWQNESPQHGGHERIRSARQEAVDPGLKAAAERELRAKDFVLAEYQEECADRNAQSGKYPGVAVR